MTTEAGFIAILEVLGEKLKEQETEIFVKDFQIRELKEKLAEAERSTANTVAAS